MSARVSLCLPASFERERGRESTLSRGPAGRHPSHGWQERAVARQPAPQPHLRRRSRHRERCTAVVAAATTGQHAATRRSACRRRLHPINRPHAQRPVSAGGCNAHAAVGTSRRGSAARHCLIAPSAAGGIGGRQQRDGSHGGGVAAQLGHGV
eukprot:180289-Chlamydomonas_euryale.AAC.1